MQIIKDRTIVDDHWARLFPEDDDLESADLPEGELLVSLPLWKTRRDELIERGDEVGVFLEAEDLIDEIVDDLEHLSLVALDFPHFRDGRSYSKARLLRERHGFDGQIRAVGDVQHDQLFFMERCGFDAYELAKDFDLEEALEAFEGFSVRYQPGVHEDKPLFRKVKR